MNTSQLTDAELDAANKLAWEEGRIEDVRIRLSSVPAPDMFPVKNIFEIAW